MCSSQIDANNHDRIRVLGRQVLAGGALSRAEAEWLFNLEETADIVDLMGWANRLRERHKGNAVHLCSIVNAKAGGCPEDCRFCAQSAANETGSPRSGLISSEDMLAAARQAQANGVGTLDLVVAWRGLKEGPVLDEVCQRLDELTQSWIGVCGCLAGADPNQAVADRLKQAGLVTYNHNLETSRRYFPHICSTHAYEDRVRTIGYLKQAGIRICSGGLLGMGESRADRCDLAYALKELDVDIVPLNVLNPVPGTPFEDVPPLSPFETLKTIACFRLILPRQDILIAGGRTVNLRDLQCLIFLAGASGLMVGNYLTTPNQPVERDLQMLKDLGLEPRSTTASLPACPGCAQAS